MKKVWVLFLIAVLMTGILVACQAGGAAESSPKPANPTYERAPVSEVWSAEDFARMGISDMEQLDPDALSKYKSSVTLGVMAEWTDITDFDKITEYGRALFEKTKAENGANGVVVFEDGSSRQILGDPFETFEEAASFWAADYYYSEWYYEKDGQLYQVTYFGQNNAKGCFTRLSVSPWA